MDVFIQKMSFGDLVEHLRSCGGRGVGPRIVAEGALLRYFMDIYRVMRYSLPSTCRSPAVRDVQRFLRSIIASVDSSLLDEWESLKAMEVEGQGEVRASK